MKNNPKPMNFDGPIRMTVIAFVPDKRKRDLDNIQKPLWDALQKVGVYLDDSQICDYQVLRGEVLKGGKVMVEVEEVPDFKVILMEDVLSAVSLEGGDGGKQKASSDNFLPRLRGRGSKA